MALVHRKPALKPAAAPVVSVCIANYNGRATLDACLRSVLEQQGGLSVEVIVHDDASPDHDLAGLQERFPGVELLLGEVNAGYCVSNNRMVDIARGDYVLLLNNDAALWPDALDSLRRRAQELGRPAILGLPQYDMETGRLMDRGSLLDPFFNPVPNLDARTREVGMIMGACLWIPRALWRQVGGFPEWFGSIAEDLYLCSCARLYGYPVEALDRSGFRHHVGQSFGGGRVTETGLRTTRRRRRLSERNKTFVMILCSPPPALLLMLPLHLLALAVEGLLISLLKRDVSLWREIYWHCLAECWRHRAQLWRRRAEIQRQRRASLGELFRVQTWVPYKLAMLLRHGLPRLD